MNDESNRNSGSEELEGLDERKNEPFDLGDYPIDSILIRKDVNTIKTIVERIQKKRYILNPDFQRDFLWDNRKASRLIESLVLRIPLPVFYLAENPDGKVVVVDGLQRLSTFNRFCNDEFKLTGLKHHVLDGKLFSELPEIYQERITDTNLTLYLLDPKAPEQIRLDIFERVNSGVPLTRQQMRNCIYTGAATRWLKKMAEHKLFIEVTTGSLDSKSMRDREFINRFCSFYSLGVAGYINKSRGDMDEFLAEGLKNLNHDPGVIPEMEEAFLLSMRNNRTVFARYAFRKHRDTNTPRSVINAALFDVFSVLFTRLPEQVAAEKTGKLHQIFYNLLDNDEFQNAITIGTNDVRRVISRFEIASEAYKEFIK